MTAVPPVCADLVADVDASAGRYAELSHDVSGEIGAAGWRGLAQLAVLRAQHAGLLTDVGQCVAIASSADLSGVLVVIDSRPEPVDEKTTVAAWDVASRTAAGEARTIGDAFAFPGPVPTNFAVTVTSRPADASAEVWGGFDFRSGPLLVPVTAPVRIETLIVPAVHVSGVELAAWGEELVVPSTRVETTGIPLLPVIDIAVDEVRLAPGGEGITVAARVLVSAETANPLNVPTVPTPIDVSVVVTVAPDSDPVGQQLVAVAAHTPTASSSGPLAGLADAVIPVIANLASSQISGALSALLSSRVSDCVAGAFCITELPPSTQVCLRGIRTSAGGLDVDAVVGTLGTALSTYQPQPLPIG